MRVLYCDRISIWIVGSRGGRKTGEPGEKPSRAGENQKQCPPHMATGRNRTQATLVGGERSHHCAILAFEVTLAKNGMSLRRRQSLILLNDSYF